MNDITRRRSCARLLYLLTLPIIAPIIFIAGFIQGARYELRRIRKASRS